MAKERKRIESKPIKFIPPKKRDSFVADPDPIIEPTKINLTHKYVKVGCNSTAAEFKLIGERVQKGELGVPYYTIENDKGYFYYIVLKTI